MEEHQLPDSVYDDGTAHEGPQANGIVIEDPTSPGSMAGSQDKPDNTVGEENRVGDPELGSNDNVAEGEDKETLRLDRLIARLAVNREYPHPGTRSTRPERPVWPDRPQRPQRPARPERRDYEFSSPSANHRSYSEPIDAPEARNSTVADTDAHSHSGKTVIAVMPTQNANRFPDMVEEHTPDEDSAPPADHRSRLTSAYAPQSSTSAVANVEGRSQDEMTEEVGIPIQDTNRHVSDMVEEPIRSEDSQEVETPIVDPPRPMPGTWIEFEEDEDVGGALEAGALGNKKLGWIEVFQALLIR